MGCALKSIAEEFAVKCIHVTHKFMPLKLCNFQPLKLESFSQQLSMFGGVQNLTSLLSP